MPSLEREKLRARGNRIFSPSSSASLTRLHQNRHRPNLAFSVSNGQQAGQAQAPRRRPPKNGSRRRIGERIGSVIPSNSVATGVNTPILGSQLRIALASRISISTCAITVTKKLIVIRNALSCSLCHTVQRITVSSSIRYTTILQFGYAYHNPFLSFNSPHRSQLELC